MQPNRLAVAVDLAEADIIVEKGVAAGMTTRVRRSFGRKFPAQLLHSGFNSEDNIVRFLGGNGECDSHAGFPREFIITG